MVQLSPSNDMGHTQAATARLREVPYHSTFLVESYLNEDQFHFSFIMACILHLSSCWAATTRAY